MDKTVSELTNHAESILALLRKIELETKNTPERNETSYRIIHLKANPMEMAIRRQRKEFELIKKENDILRARCELLEFGNNADVTRRIDDAVDQAHQVEILSRKISEFKQREEKILHSLRKTSGEFREAIHLLTGYKVYALKNRIYRLSNVYAENENDNLLFEISPDGTVKLLRNSYSDSLTDKVRTYIERGDSFPAFLASITLDLMKSRTQLAPMDMSTTMMSGH